MTLPARDSLAETSTDSTAVADAARILERIRDDERAAAEARRRYRTAPVEPIPPTVELLPHLEPGEELLAIRSTSLLEDCGPTDVVDSPRTGGAMYLTNRRLLQLGRGRMTIDLAAIDELDLAGERLLLTLRDGHGFALDVPEPRLFRVEIAAVLRSARS